MVPRPQLSPYQIPKARERAQNGIHSNASAQPASSLIERLRGDHAETMWEGLMADSLAATIEGPLGKAEIYELTNTLQGGALQIEYEVRMGTQVQKFAALGAAYI